MSRKYLVPEGAVDVTKKDIGRLIVPNDKLSKTLVFANDLNGALAKGKIIDIDLVETPNKKSRQISTIVRLQFIYPTDKIKILSHDKGNQIVIKLDQNARDILAACISLKLAGNEFVTIGSIYHVLTGDKSKRIDEAYGMQKTLIDALMTLMFTTITVDMAEICKKFKYNRGEILQFKGVPLLPAEFCDGVNANGTPCTAIHFLRDSPIYTIAAAKNQLLTIDLSLFNIPNQRNTPMTSAIKHYLIYRVKEIKAHAKNLTPTITYDDVFDKCGLTDVAKVTKNRARKIIDEVLNHLLIQGEIKSCETIKKGQKFHAASFIF